MLWCATAGLFSLPVRIGNAINGPQIIQSSAFTSGETVLSLRDIAKTNGPATNKKQRDSQLRRAAKRGANCQPQTSPATRTPGAIRNITDFARKPNPRTIPNRTNQTQLEGCRRMRSRVPVARYMNAATSMIRRLELDSDEKQTGPDEQGVPERYQRPIRQRDKIRCDEFSASGFVDGEPTRASKNKNSPAQTSRFRKFTR